MATPQFDPMPLDRAAEINRDLYCPTCGYNQRGLRATARCPECNSPVEWALAGGDLYYSNPVWVRKLASGAGWLTVLLPWLWLPLSWPVLLWARLRLGARPPLGNPGPQGRLWHWQLGAWLIVAGAVACVATASSRAPAADVAILELTLIIVHESLLFIASRAYGLAGRVHVFGLKRLATLLCWINLSALGLHFGRLIDARFGLGMLLFTAGGMIANLLTLVAVPLSMLVSWLLWRRLSAAAAHARALRSEVWFWQVAEPGSGYQRTVQAA